MPGTPRMPATPRMPGTPCHNEELQSIAIEGCDGCTKLVNKVNNVKQAWKRHCTSEVFKESNKAKDKERKEAERREAKMKIDWEAEKRRMEEHFIRQNKDIIDQLRAELEEEREKRKQLDDAKSNDENNLRRTILLIEKYKGMRVEAICLLEQTMELIRQEETNVDKNSRTNGSTTTASTLIEMEAQSCSSSVQQQQKKYEDAEIQTDPGLNCPENPATTNEDDKFSDVHKLAKRLVRKRKELSKAVEYFKSRSFVTELSLPIHYGDAMRTTTVPNSDGIEQEEGEIACNGEPPAKRTIRTESSPVQDPAPTLSHLPQSYNNVHLSNNSAICYDDDDDDDIQFLEEVNTRQPHTPPPPPITRQSFMMNGGTLNNNAPAAFFD